MFYQDILQLCVLYFIIYQALVILEVIGSTMYMYSILPHSVCIVIGNGKCMYSILPHSVCIVIENGKSMTNVWNKKHCYV